MRLYTHYRSQASFRVGIAINPKGTRERRYLPSLERGNQFAAE